MISRAIVSARAMSEPTSMPSHRSAHSAVDVRRGSITISRAPFRMPFRTWWKKIGWVSRAFEPHSTMRSQRSTSSYELVPPPAPNTVARPTTEGACQVRLQLSMLLLPRACRTNFCATKFISFEALEQLNVPTPQPGLRSFAARSPAAARSSASSQVAARSSPCSRTRGVVSRLFPLPTLRSPFGGSAGRFYRRGRAAGTRGRANDGRRPVERRRPSPTAARSAGLLHAVRGPAVGPARHVGRGVRLGDVLQRLADLTLGGVGEGHVAERQDSDELVALHHRQPADLVLGHDVAGLG